MPDIEPFGAPGKKAYDLVHKVMPFVWDNGGAELSDDAKKSTINTPEAQQGVEFMGDLITAGLFDKSQLERDGTQVENQFKGGRLAVWIGGPWVLGSIDRRRGRHVVRRGARERRRRADADRPGGKAYTFVGGSDLMVFKSSKHPNEAWALLKFLSEDQTQKDYAKLLGMFPARLEPQQRSVTPPRTTRRSSRPSRAGGRTRRSRSGARSRTRTRRASGTFSTAQPASARTTARRP